MLIQCRKCGKWGESAGMKLADDVKAKLPIEAVEAAMTKCVDCTEEHARQSGIPVEMLWKKH